MVSLSGLAHLWRVALCSLHALAQLSKRGVLLSTAGLGLRLDTLAPPCFCLTSAAFLRMLAWIPATLCIAAVAVAVGVLSGRALQ